MSVRTTADDEKIALVAHLQMLEGQIDSANRSIRRMLDPDTWGSKTFNPEFVNETETLQSWLNHIDNTVRGWLRKYQ